MRCIRHLIDEITIYLYMNIWIKGQVTSKFYGEEITYPAYQNIYSCGGMVDTQHLGCCAARFESSNLSGSTIIYFMFRYPNHLFFCLLNRAFWPVNNNIDIQQTITKSNHLYPLVRPKKSRAAVLFFIYSELPTFQFLYFQIPTFKFLRTSELPTYMLLYRQSDLTGLNNS